jgi:hypothetical protein
MDTQPLAVRCTGCGAELEVSSRSQFSIIEDLHREACDIQRLAYDGDVDTLLALPPFEPSDAPEQISLNRDDALIDRMG